MRRLALIALLCMGCAHRVRILSQPPGAIVRVGDETLGPTPQELRRVWVPLRRMRVRLEAEGYRPAILDLRRDVGVGVLVRDVLALRTGVLLGREVRTTHEVLLIRRHGGAGTWTPEEAKRASER